MCFSNNNIGSIDEMGAISFRQVGNLFKERLPNYFAVELDDHDKPWTPHISRHTSIKQKVAWNLEFQWLGDNRRRISMTTILLFIIHSCTLRERILHIWYRTNGTKWRHPQRLSVTSNNERFAKNQMTDLIRSLLNYLS